MIGALLRADLAIWSLKFFLIPYGLMMTFVIMTLGQGQGVLRTSCLIMTLAGWVVGLKVLDPQLRFSEFQITQPVPPRLMLGLRIVALCLQGLVPLAIFTAAVTLFGGDERSAVWLLAANLGPAVVFASVVIHQPSPEYHRVVGMPKILAAACPIVASFVVAAWIEDPRFGLLLLAASAVLAWIILSSLPPGLLLAPAVDKTDRDRSTKAGGSGVVGRPARPRWLLAGWILRKTALTRMALFFGLIGVFKGGIYGDPVQSYFLVLGLLPGIALCRIFSISHLPLSRRQLFPYIALPGFLWLVISVAAATWPASPVSSFRNEPVDLMRTNEYVQKADGKYDFARNADGTQISHLHLLIPDSYWKLGLGRVTPVIRAPWGEEILVNTYPFSVLGLPIYQYNPYEVSAASSIEFVAWQFSRAVAEVYAFQISPDDLRERYLQLSSDGEVQLRYPEGKTWHRGFHFGLRMDHPELVAGPVRSQALTLATMFLACVLSWASVLFFILLLCQPSTTLTGWKRGRWMKLGLVVLACALYMFPLVVYWASFEARGYIFDVPEIFDVAEGLAFRMLATGLPENGWLCWALVLLVTGVLYFFLERRFSKMELPSLRL